MHLTPEEYAVFREAQDGLLLFIHQARKLEPAVRTREGFAALPSRTRCRLGRPGVASASCSRNT